ncbi:hypothetical protein HMI56_007414 [Coelomomyces lativittatus]|nr:hypothetical protein HMI56_007414 [Coelomomyces lativittatus]
MKYPSARPTLKNGVADDYSSIQPIRPADIPIQMPDGYMLYKPYPCGNSNPNSDKFKLEKGQTLPVEIDIENWHDGGTCQFSISYDNAKTFVVFHQILNDCLDVGPALDKTKINVPIPNDLPGGSAVFAWTWITKKSRDPEFYMSVRNFFSLTEFFISL